MNLYEAMYSRKTVRKFNMKPIEVVTMLNFQRYIKAMLEEQCCKGCSVEIIDTLTSNKKVKGLFKVVAPYYFIVYCENSIKGFYHAGCLAEMLVLYLTSKGIGTCYQGELKIEPVKDELGVCPGIAVAFGYSNENIYRESGRAKRLKLNDIIFLKEEINTEVEAILKGARLAPSAFNMQPWRFVVYHNRIHLFLKKDPIIIKKFKQVNRVDIGIVLSHLLLGAEEFWLNATVTQVDSLSERELKNYEYIITVLLDI